MKKLTRILALTASLLALTLVGCSSSVDDATINGDNLKGTRTLKIYATSKDNVITFAPKNNARTITPTAIDGSDTKYHFFLSGTNLITSTDVTRSEVTFVSTGTGGTEGIVDKELDVANYELILEVTKEGTYNANEVILYAKAYADLRYNESIKFFLMPATGGTGTVSLKVYSDGWDIAAFAGYTATGKITALDTDVVQTGFETTFSPLPTTAPAAANFPTSQEKSLSSGTYNFVVEFKNDTLGKTFYWSDRIVVLRNQNTEASIAIPKVIGELPDKPLDLYVGYKVPEKDDALYYTAEFIWDDDSENEQSFQLDLLDITEVNETESIAGGSATYGEAINSITSSDATADANWVLLAKTSDSKGVEYSFDSSVYKVKETSEKGGITYNEGDGVKKSSLAKNNEQLALNLPLGKRYLARISAMNSAGNSKYTYAIFADTTPAIDPAPTFNYGTKLWPEKAKNINVYKITYNLVGGDFYEADYNTTIITPSGAALTETVATETPLATVGKYSVNKAKNKIIQFDCQSSVETNAVILNPLKVTNNEATPKTVALFNGSNKWVGWKEDSTTNTTMFKTTADPAAVLTPYTGCKNLNLYAAYSSATAKIYNPADYKITPADVKLETGATPAYATGTPFTSGGTIITESAKYLYILVKNDNKYSNVQVELKETNGTNIGTYKSTSIQTINDGTADHKYETFVIPTTSIKTSSFQATIQAYEGITVDTPYTYPVIFTITD